MSKRYKVYLAGPINACDDKQATSWREELKQRVDGVEWIDPMRRDYRGQEILQYKRLVEEDMEDIRTCDIFLANCWKPSFGTAMEIHFASHCLNKPVVVIVQSTALASPWLRYHAKLLLSNVEEAVMCLRSGDHLKYLEVTR